MGWFEKTFWQCICIYMCIETDKQAISKESCRCAAEVARIAKKLHSDAMASCLKREASALGLLRQDGQLEQLKQVDESGKIQACTSSLSNAVQCLCGDMQ